MQLPSGFSGVFFCPEGGEEAFFEAGGLAVQNGCFRNFGEDCRGCLLWASSF